MEAQTQRQACGRSGVRAGKAGGEEGGTRNLIPKGKRRPVGTHPRAQ